MRSGTSSASLTNGLQGIQCSACCWTPTACREISQFCRPYLQSHTQHVFLCRIANWKPCSSEAMPVLSVSMWNHPSSSMTQSSGTSVKPAWRQSGQRKEKPESMRNEEEMEAGSRLGAPLHPEVGESPGCCPTSPGMCCTALTGESLPSRYQLPWWQKLHTKEGHLSQYSQIWIPRSRKLPRAVAQAGLMG